MDEAQLKKITETIIGGAFQVSNALGCGFLEKVYENALAIELAKSGLVVKRQCATTIYYDGHVVGDYCADLIVNDLVIVEIKAVQDHHEVFAAQCINYLRATGKPICLLLNFGKPKVDVKRYKNLFDVSQPD